MPTKNSSTSSKSGPAEKGAASKTAPTKAASTTTVPTKAAPIKSAASSATEVTAKDLRQATKSLKPKVHVHKAPKCRGEEHNPACEGKGAELSCNQVTVLGKKFYVCTHIEPSED